jgi:hypothetical protein
MLDAPGATDGWTVDDVAMVRTRAKDALDAAKAGVGSPATPAAAMSGGG